MNAVADLFMKRSARISQCGAYRWTLTRQWGEGPMVCYIGHNPSTADAEVDDPTVLAWIHFAKLNGFTGFVAVNLYPLRTPDVKECARWAAWDKNGPDWWARDRIHENMGVVERVAASAARVVACWGALCRDPFHAEAVLEEIDVDLYCLGTTLAGDPKHPMARGKHRIQRDQRFTLWRRA